MVQFTSLRLNGFKSFVDPTELEIAPGLTGVVGPNGCGKSNLLEAIRWCMGEASAKKLRGGGMDDVIFSGSGRRAARNVAEVVLKLDNSFRDAPASFNDYEELEIVRRIEREQGSAYTVNGQEARARDVQLLFADLSTGAKSAAIVSQGRVASVISAKPEDRRQLLEEAAGITGLHSRRHEAELRLKAAETNLERLEDVVVALEGQMQNLKRQARQATRYRNLSGHIRRAEAMVLHLRWAAALAALDDARTKLAENSDRVAELTAAAARAATAQAEAAGRLPGLRQTEGEAAAALQRLIVEREQLDAEEERIRARQAEYEAALEQVQADTAREQQFGEEAAAARTRLEAEREELTGAQESDADARAAAARQVGEASEQVEALEARVTRMTEKVAQAEARRSDLDRRIQELSERIALCALQAEEAQSETGTVRALPVAQEADDAAAEVARAEEAVATAQTGSDEADARKSDALAARDAAREARTEADEAATRLRAETDALQALAAGGSRRDADGLITAIPVLNDLLVTPGYEAAIGAALGDDLELSADVSAPAHWGEVIADASAPLPPGTRPMIDYVQAPAALSARLSQIAVVETAEAAEAARPHLKQGQRLVTRDGALWRWDGLHVGAGAPTAAATRLEQRNRLVAAEAELGEAEGRLQDLSRAADEAGQAAAGADEAAQTAATALRRAMVTLSQARERQDQAVRAAGEQRSRLKVLEDAIARLGREQAEAAGKKSDAEAERETLAALDDERDQLNQMRDDLAAARAAFGEAQNVQNRLTAEAEARGRRLTAIGEEIGDWSRRAGNAATQIAQLAERAERTSAQIAELASKPAEFEAARQTLLTAISEADARRSAAAEALAAGEAALREADETLKAAERLLADAREEKGRREGAVAQAEQTVTGLVEQIGEKLRAAPEQALEISEHKEGAELPPLDDMERKLERLVRERENMGAVNLRAEQEAEELQEQIDSYAAEREDLVQAIEKFRRAISDLNREGKQRLLASFDKVNTHFEALFTELFGGGHAHLKLTDMDDPLNAGIEIMASPPGKKLQSLSLLSGGEQALTALSLLFAVFLTNPAPICILDEVDAPLDDTNVDRFCSLVEDIAARTDTRFLIVTHHRMTMARVNRLYGVTMAEQGVSQLVSVDLEAAEALRETA